jgi:hypothetical protein
MSSHQTLKIKEHTMMQRRGRPELEAPLADLTHNRLCIKDKSLAKHDRHIQ